VRVSASGKKSFTVFYRHAGRVRRLTLGTYPPITLADAREMAREALREAALGGDPATRKKEERKADSFAQLAHEYLERHAKPNKRSWKEDNRIIATDLLPAWRNINAKDVTRADVRALLDRILERGAPILANRVRSLISKIFNWGISRDLVYHNPCLGLPRPAPEHQRDRVLSEGEIRRVWEALEFESSPIAESLKLRLLTAQRGGEVLGIRLQDVDFETRWWTISARHSKNKLAHRVPLSEKALQILRELREQSNGSEWFFPSPRGSGPIENIQKALERIRENAQVEFRAHDLRRTAATYMTSMGIPRLIVSKILNHAEQGVTSIYDRSSYDREKRQALDAWARKLETIVASQTERSRIVAFRK
jgi:integrase